MYAPASWWAQYANIRRGEIPDHIKIRPQRWERRILLNYANKQQFKERSFQEGRAVTREEPKGSSYLAQPQSTGSQPPQSIYSRPPQSSSGPTPLGIDEEDEWTDDDDFLRPALSLEQRGDPAFGQPSPSSYNQQLPSNPYQPSPVYPSTHESNVLPPQRPFTGAETPFQPRNFPPLPSNNAKPPNAEASQNTPLPSAFQTLSLKDDSDHPMEKTNESETPRTYASALSPRAAGKQPVRK